MTESNVFNSVFEYELRVLILLLSARKKAMSAERIAALDFITCYASYFQLPYLNLQGDNQYMYTELPARRDRIRETIKSLVKRGMLDVVIDGGYIFCLWQHRTTSPQCDSEARRKRPAIKTVGRIPEFACKGALT